jgi:hypothetical protein
MPAMPGANARRLKSGSNSSGSPGNKILDHAFAYEAVTRRSKRRLSRIAKGL